MLTGLLSVVLACSIFPGLPPRASRKLVPAVVSISLARDNAQTTRAEAGKKHQATGEILSANPTELILLHARGRTKQKMAFSLTPQTRKSGEIVKGARVTVYYRQTERGRVAIRIRPARSNPPHYIPKPQTPHS